MMPLVAAHIKSVVLSFFMMAQMVSNIENPLEGKSDDYKDGFCAGWDFAVEVIHRNRDHFMKMTRPDSTFETHPEAIKRISSSPWEELHRESNIVDQVESIMRDSVDLYVVLPKEKLQCR